MPVKKFRYTFKNNFAINFKILNKRVLNIVKKGLLNRIDTFNIFKIPKNKIFIYFYK